MIPKIIHHIWLGPMQVPEGWINSWTEHHPDWEHRLWTEGNIDFPLKCIRQYLLAQTYAGKADILLCEILWRCGGIYLDADSLSLRHLDDELLSKNFLAAYENEKVRPGLVANGIVGCRPKHPVIKDMIDEIRNLTPKEMLGYDFVVTGPELLTKILCRHAYVEIMPSYLFYPYHYSGEKCSAEQFEKAYAIQMWGSTADWSDDFKSIRERYGYRTTAYSGTREQEPLAAIKHTVVKQTPECRVHKYKGHILLETENGGDSMRLSDTAYLIWELCREWIKLQEITETLVSEFPADPDEIRRDVHELACELIRKGMLLVNPESPCI